MQNRQQVFCEIKDHIMLIRVDNHETKNGLDWDGIEQLARSYEELQANPDVRVGIITGNEQYFYTGGRVDPNAPGEKDKYTDALTHFLKASGAVTKPMIAAVNGDCMKAGMGVLALCDFAVARKGVVFNFPEVRMGGVPMMVLVDIVDAMPRKRALEALLTSWELSAEEALQMGLVNRVVAKEEFWPTVYRFADGCENSASSQFPLVGSEQIQGKPLSYNNYLDADAAWNLVREFDEPACVILKHQNPCGSATGATVEEAYDKAFACDPKSAFGGIIAANVEVSLAMVEHINENKQFVEVLIAPSFEPAALELLQQKKNLRVLRTGGVDAPAAIEFRSVDGGMLAQCVDRVNERVEDFTVPTKRKPTEAEMDELMFAWKVCKGVKSNAILVSKGKAGIGMGPGQPNRVDSAKLACERAHEACERMGMSADGLMAASDAFFPFRDGVDQLASYGITAIIQPGGSVRDEEVIQACDEHGIAMVFTGHRHFRH